MQPQPESEPQHKKGKTVLKRVGATRQLSSQASLPLIPSEQSWKQTIGLPEEKCSKRETEAFIMNQMLTHYQHKASRKIPGGCTQSAGCRLSNFHPTLTPARPGSYHVNGSRLLLRSHICGVCFENDKKEDQLWSALTLESCQLTER